ncbi:hypothetical protein D3C85_1583280 [compost metagenome]
MGNVVEDWMCHEVSKIGQNKSEVDFSIKSVEGSSKWLFIIKTKFFGKIILNKKIMKYFLIWKGLSKEDAGNYLI